MRIPKWLERFRDGLNWGWLAYRVAWVLVATGIASAIGGGIWAVLIGVPLPIAIMAGYCTSQSKTAPDYKAWSLIKLIRPGDAACLWCDRDPHVDSSAPEIETWLNVFKDAVRSKELRVTLGDWADSSDIRSLFPDAGTTVKRSDQSQYAKAKGYDPRF